VLALPPLGCLNIHGSLLPRWRGAAPVQRAIEAGDASTGVTIMQMDAGLDTGAMRLVALSPISADDTSATLMDRLAGIGAQAIVDALRDLAALPSLAQPEVGVTYAAKITKDEAAIDWREPAALIERRVRAFDPFPGASFAIPGAAGAEAVKLWRARVRDERPAAAEPGEVLASDDHRLTIACAEGALDLLELQWPGGRRQTWPLATARRPAVGSRLASSLAA
jgi:methionyl-tRNA formyltransferase